MKNVSKLLVISLMLVLVSMLVAPVAAQDGAGEGGIIVLSNTAGDPVTFNPLISGDATSSDVWGRFYPTLFTVDSDTGVYVQGLPGTIATSWEYDETGTVLTFHLREDAFWNDGVQITASDFLWGATALRDPELGSPRSSMWETLADGTPSGGSVVDIQAPDDFTLVFTFNRADCQALSDIYGPSFVPAHIFEERFGDDYAAMNDDPRFIPEATWGAWTDPELVPGDRVSLIADQSYPDSVLGYVSPSTWVYLGLADSDISLERFRAGELTIEGIPASDQSEFRELAANGEFQIYEFNSRGYNFIALNLANPENPTPMVDDEGNILEQDPHPILADVKVRQALSYAVDMQTIIDEVLDGNAVNISTTSIPTMWDYDPDMVYPYDPEAAAALLDEAGWVLEEGSDVRVCRGCAYTEIDPDYEGTPMELTLQASSGAGDDYERRITAMVDYINQVGVGLEAEYNDWSSVVVPMLLGQTFDLLGLSWSVGLPLDPDQTAIFDPGQDIPGGGYNFVSWYNEEYIQLMDDARNPELTDGCTIEGRLPYYQRANEIMYEEQPYLFLYHSLSMSAAQPFLENWNPKQFSRTDGEDAWVIDSDS